MQDEHVFAAHVLLNLDENLLIGEAPDGGLADRQIEVTGDRLGQNPVGVAREEFHVAVLTGKMSGFLAAITPIARVVEAN